MTNLIAEKDVTHCASDTSEGCTVESYPAREAELGGGLKIRRALPTRGKRMLGAWCFLDHFGPLAFGDRKAMDVAPHPHIGLQTVTWLLQGEVLHKDSLGFEQVIRPGQLNIMTAGEGIVHSEETPPEHSGRVHGVQLWVALPDGDRRMEPAFDHHPELPEATRDGMRIHVFAGEALGAQSPARLYSPMVGMDVAVAEAGDRVLPLRADFEHGLIVVEGAFRGDETEMTQGALYDLGIGREGLRIQTSGPARFVLIGGAPFGEEIAMWWNFVARTHEELRQAREDWEAGRHFGEVKAYTAGPRLTAPALNVKVGR